MIKGILFDLDGVLVDAPVWHQEAFNKALVACGYESTTKEYHDTYLNGLGTPEKLRKMGIDEWDVDIINYKKQLITKEIINERCVDDPFKRDVLKYAASVAKIALVTNCSRETALMLLEKAGLRKELKVIVTANEVRKKKPSPIPYRQGAAYLGLHASECLAIDDSNHGVESATKAGCKVWRLENIQDLTTRNLMDKLKEYNELD